MTGVAYRRVHVVINPASGKDEPILNVLNDVFREHDVAWDASVTHRYGDAGNQARDAIGDGVDLVVAYGGDGTQHEVANAVVTAALTKGRQVPMGILPGGTGNGFAREVGVPRNVRDATILLCTSSRTRAIDVGRLRSIGEAQVDEKYFIQRLYIGVEPEEQQAGAQGPVRSVRVRSLGSNARLQDHASSSTRLISRGRPLSSRQPSCTW